MEKLPFFRNTHGTRSDEVSEVEAVKKSLSVSSVRRKKTGTIFLIESGANLLRFFTGMGGEYFSSGADLDV